MKNNHQIALEICLIILLVLSVALLAWGLLSGGSCVLKKAYQANKLPAAAQLQESTEAKKPAVEPSDTSDWLTYRHDVLGLEFKYPAAWGEPKTEPREQITDLGRLDEDYSSPSLAGIVRLSFAEKLAPDVILFSDKYRGAYGLGDHYQRIVTQELSNLRSSGAICEFDVSTRWNNYRDGYDTVYQECGSSDQTYLVRTRQQNTDGANYRYRLGMASYDRLENGYYDHLLANFVLRASERKVSDALLFVDILGDSAPYERDPNEGSLTQEELASHKKDFAVFMASIKAFVPPEPTKEEFVPVAGENFEIARIRQYYQHIENGDLLAASDMRGGSGFTFPLFEELYQDAHLAQPRDFVALGGGRYDFYVDYQDHNSSPQEYHVVMNVHDGKLGTELTEEILLREPFGDMLAITKRRSEKTYLILERGEEEIVVAEGRSKEIKGKEFGVQNVKFWNLEFSPTGRYLLFTEVGWEWGINRVYDIKEGQEVLKLGFVRPKFTSDERYAFECSSAGMVGATGTVHSLPDGEKVFDIFERAEGKQVYEVKCELSDDESEVTFIFGGFQPEREETLPETIIYRLK